MLNFFKKFSAMSLEDEAVKKAICRVIETRTHYGYSGHPQVKKFETALSQRLGGVPVLGMNSGTDALVAALKVLGIGPGDEVIVTSFSFISTASPIRWVGANPVFVDIRERDYAADPSQIESKITPRTKAIVLAHLFGQPAEGVGAICAAARKNKIPVIEDAAHAFGAKVRAGGEWRMVGTVGTIGCLSFSSTKPFAAPGNGGALILNDHSLVEEADRMRFYGAKKHYYDYTTVGINSKLHEIQAAALLAKLPFFDYWLEHRKSVGELYARELPGTGDIKLPETLDGTERTFYRYVIRTGKREALLEHLIKKAGALRHLRPMVNYPVPLPHFTVFKDLGHRLGDFPAAERASSEVISLPITNFVTKSDAVEIVGSIKAFFRQAA